jgi:hypothetical protein
MTTLVGAVSRGLEFSLAAPARFRALSRRASRRPPFPVG